MKKNATLLVLLGVCPALYGGAISNTSLGLTSLTISSNDATGTVESSFFSPGIFGDVEDSVFGYYNYTYDGYPFNSDDPASGSAGIPFGYVNDSASGASGPTLSATSGAHVFGITDQANTATGNNANVSGTFDIVDATNDYNASPVMVTLTALLNASQMLLTNTNGLSSGVSAFSETTFALDLSDAAGTFYDQNFLFYDSALTIGPNSSYSAASSPNPTGSISLMTNTTYDLYLEADAESLASNSVAPEPTSLMLMAAALAGLGLRRLRRG